MNLNRIAKELLEEKREHARTLAMSAPVAPPAQKTGNTATTPPAPRLCHCGCREPLTRNPNESQARFKARPYVSQLHADAQQPTPQDETTAAEGRADGKY